MKSFGARSFAARPSRRSERASVLLPASIVTMSAYQYPELLNISQSGIERVGQKWIDLAAANNYTTKADRDTMNGKLKNDLQKQASASGVTARVRTNLQTEQKREEVTRDDLKSRQLPPAQKALQEQVDKLAQSGRQGRHPWGDSRTPGKRAAR